jgi:hypothetical protein
LVVDTRGFNGKTWLDQTGKPTSDALHVFFADGKLEKIAITGGSAVTVCDSINNPYGATWALDDEIYFGQGPKGILRVSAKGGSKPETVVSVKSGEMAHGSQVLPGGDALLFTLANTSSSDPWDNAQLLGNTVSTSSRVRGRENRNRTLLYRHPL